MKKLIAFSFLVVLLSSFSCKTTQNSQNLVGSDGGTLEKKWRLTELNGKPVVLNANKKPAFIKIDLSANAITGNDGCNSLHGIVEAGKNNRIKFSKIASTLMACPDMTAEESFHKVLETADNYTIKNGVLTLNKARMASLAKFEEMKENPLEGEWELDYISGQRIAFEGLYPEKKPSIRFEADKKEATGHSSCNGYGVAFEVNGNSIKFADPTATMMACEGGGEQFFFRTLKTVTQYSVSENTLNLIMGDIAVMRFQRKK